MIVSKGVGIDLGTTNSAVAVMDPTNSQVIVHEDTVGRKTTPSCVWRDSDSAEIVVGHHAYQRRGSIPEPVRSVKRDMGSDVNSDLSGRQVTPTEVSSLILRELRGQITADVEQFGEDAVRYAVDRAIITVPAYFDLPAIEATREAGRMAELEVLELLNEPTAGAIHYCWKHDIGEGLFLVYDLGGGTFDVSVLQRIANEFSVLAISGDNFLGGDNFDVALARLIEKKLAADGYDLDADATGDPQQRLVFNQLLRLAEQTKIALSEQDQFLLRDQSLADADGNRVIAEMMIEREEFENLIRDEIATTLDLAHDALRKAEDRSGTGLSDIEHVVLVGGSTYIPLVQRMIKQSLCDPDDGARCDMPSPDTPNLAVAMGAAIRAASLGVRITDDDRTASISFRGLSATDSPVRTISGRAEPIDGGCNLSGGTICLSSDDGEIFLEETLDQDGAFSFREVPVGTGDSSVLNVSVIDAEDRTVTSFAYNAVHGRARQRLGSADFGTAVLPMPILLEGREGDQLTQRELLAEGETLPAKGTFTFYLSDRSGTVRLPIYQGNRVIKEILADIPPTLPVGTPLLFQIECDRQAQITVECRVGEEAFGGSIEPPPPEAPPTEDELDVTVSRFDTMLGELDEDQRPQFQEQFNRLIRELRGAQGAGDSAMAIQRMADLQGLVKRMELERPLRPPLDEALEIVDRCESIWQQAEADVEGIDEERFEEFCASTRNDLEEAYAARREQQYRELIERAGVMEQYLRAQVEEEEAKDLSDEERADRALDELEDQTMALALFAALSSEQSSVTEMEEALRTLHDTRSEWQDEQIDAREVLRRCQMVHNTIRRAAERLRPEDEGAKGYVQFQGGGFEDAATGGDLFGQAFSRRAPDEE